MYNILQCTVYTIYNVLYLIMLIIQELIRTRLTPLPHRDSVFVRRHVNVHLRKRDESEIEGT